MNSAFDDRVPDDEIDQIYLNPRVPDVQMS